MLLIVLVVIFVMAMFLWMLSNLEALPGRLSNNWLAFFAVLVLGIAVFLLGSGVVVWHR